MPRSVSPGDRRANQLLIRITDNELEVLQTAGHLRGISPNTYAHELLKSHLANLENDEFVRSDIDNRRAFARASGSVTPLNKDAARDDSNGSSKSEEQTGSP